MSKSDNISKENSRIGARNPIKYDASTIGLNHGTGESFDNSIHGPIDLSLRNKEFNKGDEPLSSKNKILLDGSVGLATDLV